MQNAKAQGKRVGRRPTAKEDIPSVFYKHYPTYAAKKMNVSELARVCGLVTMRQRPQTANGVIFVSLEDETGIVNVIVRPQVAERQRLPLLQSRLMAVHGVWQRHEGVCHLMAGRLVDLSHLLGTLPIHSRNFHHIEHVGQ